MFNLSLSLIFNLYHNFLTRCIHLVFNSGTMDIAGKKIKKFDGVAL